MAVPVMAVCLRFGLTAASAGRLCTGAGFAQLSQELFQAA